MPKVGLILEFETSGAHTKIKYRSNCSGNGHFFVVHLFVYFSGSIAVGLSAVTN